MNDKKQSQGGIVWMISTFALIGVLIGLGISSLDGSAGQASVPSAPTVGTAEEQEVVYQAPTVDDDASLGSEDAPVTIVMFSEYECPYCERFELETMPLIKENFVETGLVRIVYRDFPLSFHANAHVVAEAAECAGEYGDDMYWEYHLMLVDNYEEWTESSDIEAVLVSYGSELGLDISTCLADGTYYDEVDADLNDGRAAGVQGTPSFFINGEMVVGALPYEDYAGQDGSMNPGFETILTEAVAAAQ